VHAVITPLHETPYNEFTGEGISSSLSKETGFRLSFDTNGTISPNELLHLTCSTLIERLGRVLEILDQINVSNDLYTLVIANESPTIGNLLMRGVLQLYPDITYCAFVPESIGRRITFKLRTDDDPNAIITAAVKFNIDAIENIAAAIPRT
jgi:DNA-directed RNA polymerase subunit L